ncbi:MAG: hypothetical protein NT031_04505 [Planctomycetota bacterium]|nr:hypothetical protein [Planctomycetota bacterium]
MAFFARPGMEGVSAVVFSCTATMSKVHALGNDAGVKRVFFGLRYNKHRTKAHQFSLEKPGYRESLLDGLAIFLNPFASNPIDPTWLSRPGIAIHGYDPESGQDWVDSQDGFLFARQCFTVLPSALSEQVKHRIPQTSGFKTKVLPEWAEGELQPVGGTVGLAQDNFMAHYRGWTVVVFRDVVDNDWGSNGRPGVYHRLVKYIQANREDDKDMILCKECLATKEDALAAVKEQIDKILGVGG